MGRSSTIYGLEPLVTLAAGVDIMFCIIVACGSMVQSHHETASTKNEARVDAVVRELEACIVVPCVGVGGDGGEGQQCVCHNIIMVGRGNGYF